jgi:mono/diheme cytochrome c family protein
MKAAVVALSAVVATGLVTFAALAQEEDAGVASRGPVEFLGEEVDPETISLGQELYAENCASCHGANLEGQPDWKRRLENGRMPAPPHDATGHTWHHSDQSLLLITREGIEAVVPGYESDMPAFGEVLSDEEIRAVLAYIKSTWPERERNFQAEVTRNAALEEDGS